MSIAELGPFRRIDPGSGVPPQVWQQAVAGQTPALCGDPSDPSLLAIVQQRAQQRSHHDWAGADQLRMQLAALGWHVVDTPPGPRLKPLSDKASDR